MGNLPRVEVSGKHPILVGTGIRKDDALET
jgi:hypothetical protein